MEGKEGEVMEGKEGRERRGKLNRCVSVRGKGKG